MGGLLLQRESQAAEEVGVAALRPAHGCSRRGLWPDQTGQPPRRGGVSDHEEIAQHPDYHTVTLTAFTLLQGLALVIVDVTETSAVPLTSGVLPSVAN